jgi:hypothetical protein
VERIDLGSFGHTVRRWWVRGAKGHVGHAVIGLGELADQRWFVAKAERGTNMAWLARDERHACEVVERWLQHRGGMTLWREVGTPRQVHDGRR